MELSQDEQHPSFLDRGSRATRGKRMSKLLDEEVEEDEAFWNQDALKEEENDDEYEEEAEVADEFDSDFNENESEPDDEVENEADAREKRPKKRLIYPGKALLKKKRKKDLSKLEESIRDEKEKGLSKLEAQSEEKHSAQPTTLVHPDAVDEVEEEKTVRKSTRTAVIVRQAERDAIRAALQATMKPVKRKKEGEEKRMTQEEMLLEAAQTEIMNLRNLERVLAREEEVKKRAIVHKPVYTGPLVHYSSKNGHSYIELKNGLSFESQITSRSVPYPEKALCVVTGLPAKYRDPKTGLPYATKEAFQVIRERYSNEISGSKCNVIMGDLYDSVTGQGFLARRKRSLLQKETANSEYMRRFGRIPVVENLDSD